MFVTRAPASVFYFISALVVQVGQQVVGALQSALHYTDALLKALSPDNPKRAVLLTRGGEAHSRIAREHHCQPVGAASAKLASNHYHKALQYFMPEQHIGSILQVTVERADLMAKQGGVSVCMYVCLCAHYYICIQCDI